MPEIKHNIITFLPAGEEMERLYLTVNGEWVVTPGLAPNINTAEVPYTEFAKLPAVASGVIGRVEFWYSYAPGDEVEEEPAEPDWYIDNTTIVDVKPGVIGRLPGDVADRICSYILSFADFRHGFVEPRGGRVSDGLVNPDPLGGGTLVQNEDLVDKCLSAMGAGVSLPATLNDVEPVRELRWEGSHAPSELARILEHCGHAYCPSYVGLGVPVKIGTGSLPTIDSERLASVLDLDSVDRRGTAVVFVTAPVAKISTFDEAAEEAPAWEFVAQDPDDDMKWKPLASISALSDPVASVKSRFSDVTDGKRRTLDEQVYRCIRLNTTAFPPGKAAILREVFFPDGPTDAPYIVAGIAQQYGDGAWVNRTTQLYASSVLAEENILTFPQRLGTVADDERSDFDSFFTPLDAGDLLPTYSVEAWDGTQKVFAVYGFTLVEGSVSAISESTARDYLTGYRPDVCIYSAPELREIWLNASTNNREDQEAIAETYAEALVASTALTPKRYEVKGFFGVDISGRVNEVRFSQAECKTIIHVDNWQAPSGLPRRQAAGGREGTAYRPAERLFEAASNDWQPRQLANGESGALQSNSPVAATPPAETGPRAVVLRVVDPVSGQAGRYDGDSFSMKINPAASGAIGVDDLGAESSGDSVAWDVTRLGFAHHDLISGQMVSGFMTRPNSAGKPIVLVSRPVLAGELFAVSVSQNGGGNGTQTTKATWTYDVSTLGGVSLGTAVAVQWDRPKGLMIAATKGVGYYTAAGTFTLLIVNEHPDTGAC